MAVLPVEREKADREAERVEHLVLHGGEENVQLLRLRRDGAGTQVRVPSYRPEQYADLSYNCKAERQSSDTGLHLMCLFYLLTNVGDPDSLNLPLIWIQHFK